MKRKMQLVLPSVFLFFGALTACGSASGGDASISAAKSNSLAASDWSELEGCYETVTYNGQPLSSTDYNFDWAKIRDEFYMARMPGTQKTRVFEMTLLKYKEGDTYNYGTVYIFPDYGTSTISADRKVHTYSFQGKMECAQMCDQPYPFTVDVKVAITQMAPDMYEIRSYRHIPELPDHRFDADETYVVKRLTGICSRERVPRKSQATGANKIQKSSRTTPCV
jgi:hypothetical protein